MSCLLRARITNIHAKIGKVMAENKKAAITAANRKQCKDNKNQRNIQGIGRREPQPIWEILDEALNMGKLPFAVMKVLRKHKKGGSYGK